MIFDHGGQVVAADQREHAQLFAQPGWVEHDALEIWERAQQVVADGIIKSHPRFQGSSSSGYRLLEHAYGEIIQGLPEDLRGIVPLWDQIYMEQFVCGYVNGLDLPHWDSILNLTPAGNF